MHGFGVKNFQFFKITSARDPKQCVKENSTTLSQQSGKEKIKVDTFLSVEDRRTEEGKGRGGGARCGRGRPHSARRAPRGPNVRGRTRASERIGARKESRAKPAVEGAARAAPRTRLAVRECA